MITKPLENLGQLDGTMNTSKHVIAPCQDYGCGVKVRWRKGRRKEETREVTKRETEVRAEWNVGGRVPENANMTRRETGAIRERG